MPDGAVSHLLKRACAGKRLSGAFSSLQTGDIRRISTLQPLEQMARMRAPIPLTLNVAIFIERVSSGTRKPKSPYFGGEVASGVSERRTCT